MKTTFLAIIVAVAAICTSACSHTQNSPINEVSHYSENSVDTTGLAPTDPRNPDVAHGNR